MYSPGQRPADPKPLKQQKDKKPAAVSAAQAAEEEVTPVEVPNDDRF